jgi:hypothetical protein
MKALQATCILGAITFTGMIHQVGENTPGATVPDAMPEAAMSAETPGGPALSAAVPEAFAAGSGPSLMPQAEIGDDTFEAKWMALGHHDAAQPMPTTHDASDGASNPAPVTQDFRYLTYYVWSELPPAEKPAAIVLRSLKDTPVGTPVEEIKRASDAFGLTPSNAPGRISACSNLANTSSTNSAPGRSVIPATMQLRRPTSSLPKAFCSSG